jgi:hypothetical protein
MMRKGPIERFPVADTLRTAADEGRSGTISVSSATSGVIYLEKGYVYFAALDGVPVPLDMSPSERPPKEAVRRFVESVLCVLVEQREGWYEYDPLGRHPDGVRWVFGLDAMEAAVRSRLAEDAPLRPWSGRPVDLAPTPSSFVRVSADMWSVVMAMASPTSSHDLRDRLGWEPERLAVALGQLGQTGLLADDPLRRAPRTEPESAPLAQLSEGLARRGEPAGRERSTTPGPTVPAEPDVVPRPLPSLRERLERQPVAVGARTEGAMASAPASGSPQTVSDDEPAPDPPRSAAPVAAPAGGSGPKAASTNRKSALKRLISSLRQ